MLRLDRRRAIRSNTTAISSPTPTGSPLWNSLAIAPVATLIAVALGTLAAIGLSQSHVPFKGAIMAILISPMIVPLIISAAGMYFFYSRIGLQGTYWGVVLAHAALGIPFVIITVTATLVGFDRSLTRAAASLGADPVRTFFRVQMPLILPGVVAGGLFAFITSFDEVVVVLFLARRGTRRCPGRCSQGSANRSALRSSPQQPSSSPSRSHFSSRSRYCAAAPNACGACLRPRPLRPAHPARQTAKRNVLPPLRPCPILIPNGDSG